jgi:sulfite reductase beta subunit-like hemoprotein
MGAVVMSALAEAEAIGTKTKIAIAAKNRMARVIFTIDLSLSALNSRQSSHFFRLGIYPSVGC